MRCPRRIPHGRSRARDLRRACYGRRFCRCEGEHSGGCERDPRHHGDHETRSGFADGWGTRRSLLNYRAADRRGQHGTPGGGHEPGSGRPAAAGAQFCQHRLPGSGNRAGRAIGPDQGSHYGGFDGRKLGLEQRALSGWRRQFGRLHWRLSAEFLAGLDSGICHPHFAGGCGHGRDDGRVGGDHDQERLECVSRRRRILRTRSGAECAISH